jgi:hypothetical protein
VELTPAMAEELVEVAEEVVKLAEPMVERLQEKAHETADQVGQGIEFSKKRSYPAILEFQTAVFDNGNCQIAKGNLSNLTGIRSKVTQFRPVAICHCQDFWQPSQI